MCREEVEDATGEVEFHDIICEGNVFHGCMNEMEVDLEGPPVED